MSWLNRTLCLVLVCAAGAAGCNDDSLNQRFVPGDPNMMPTGPGPSPIMTGTELAYLVNHTFRRTSMSGGGGATQREAQSAGSLCLRVTNVADPATPGNETLAETVVTATTQVTGTDGSPALFFEDQDAVLATTTFDQATASLWLKQLTFPDSSHRFTTAIPVDFPIQTSPRPPMQRLEELMFFEVRGLEATGWSGWDADVAFPGTDNYLGDFFTFFSGAVSDRRKTPPDNCASFDNASDCTNALCTWSSPPEGGALSCLRIFEVSAVWRETLTEPTELAGDVLHEVRFEYDETGTLLGAGELIVPDDDPTGPLPASLECSTSPSSDVPCLIGTITNQGSWTGFTPCAF